MTPEEIKRMQAKLDRRAALQKGQAFERKIINLARLNGWRVAHFRKVKDPKTGGWRTPVGADGAGFPDLTLARGGRVVFAELKAGGDLSKDQRAWRDAIRGGATEWYLWTPADEDAIIALLAKHPPRT